MIPWTTRTAAAADTEPLALAFAPRRWGGRRLRWFWLPRWPGAARSCTLQFEAASAARACGHQAGLRRQRLLNRNQARGGSVESMISRSVGGDFLVLGYLLVLLFRHQIELDHFLPAERSLMA